MDETQSSSSAGPIIGAIVVLAIIVFGALYFIGERGGDQAATEQVNSINAQSESDDTASIEADLNSTDVESVDAEMNAS